MDLLFLGMKSTVDHDEPMEFYKNHIIPYKSDLEVWFVKTTNKLYIKIIFFTAWVIVFPSSNMVDKVFTGIPKLQSLLKYND